MILNTLHEVKLLEPTAYCKVFLFIFLIAFASVLKNDPPEAAC